MNTTSEADIWKKFVKVIEESGLDASGFAHVFGPLVGVKVDLRA